MSARIAFIFLGLVFSLNAFSFEDEQGSIQIGCTSYDMTQTPNFAVKIKKKKNNKYEFIIRENWGDFSTLEKIKDVKVSFSKNNSEFNVSLKMNNLMSAHHIKGKSYHGVMEYGAAAGEALFCKVRYL